MEQRPPTIGPYRLLEPLGQGGMGMVWRAEERNSGRVVALKTVRVPSAAMLSGIRREIHALAQLRHPGIVRILDEGLHEGMPWYAMELLGGVSLRQWSSSALAATVAFRLSLAAEPARAAEPRSTGGAWWTRTLTAGSGEIASLLDLAGVPAMAAPTAAGSSSAGLSAAHLRAVLTLVRRLCAPLAFLHGEGLVHRDLKPDNILIRDQGSGVRGQGGKLQAAPAAPQAVAPGASRPATRGAAGPAAALAPDPRSLVPVLVDFGLASRWSSDISRESLSVEAGTSGTAAYMAPEQIRGELVDARADLYALGGILFELLTGRRPFEAAQPMELVAAQLFRKPQAPSELVPGLPSELDALVLQLLEKDPRKRLGHAEVVAAALAELGAAEDPEPEPPRPQAYLYRPGFAGREQPRATLYERLEWLQQGRGGLVLLGGESGIGKTRVLLDLGREAASRGIEVLAGQCVAVGGSTLEALRKPLQVLCDRCRERGLAETEQLFGARGPVLTPYEPAIGHLPGQEAYEAPAELRPKDALLRLQRCLFETLCAAAGSSGGLLLLDDLHWADELTLSFLGYLAHAWSSSARPVVSLLVVGTYRSEETGGSLEALLEHRAVERVALGRLDEAAVASMVGDMLALQPPPAVFSRFLARQSEGSPFFVAEYLRAAVHEGLLWRDGMGRWQVREPDSRQDVEGDYERLALPRSLRELVGRRLDGLDERSRHLAQTASVLGREASLQLLQRISGLDEAELFTTTAELVRRQVMEDASAQAAPETAAGDRRQSTDVRSGAGRRLPTLRFVHDKLREAAYGRLEATRRRELHRTAARALEEALRAGDAQLHAALALHWEQGGEPERARPHALAAARRALERHALQEAESHYRAYLRLVKEPTPESIEVRNELVSRVLTLSGRNEEAIAEHEAALRDSRALGQRALEGDSLRLLGEVYRTTGRMEQALPLFEHALAILEEAGDRALEGLALGSLATLNQDQGRMEQARQLHEKALAIHREVGDRRREGIVLGHLAGLSQQQGRVEQSQQLFEQALAIHRELGNRQFEGNALGNLANLHADLGQMQQARQLYERAIAVHREVGNRPSEGIVLGNLAILHKDQGRTETALQTFEQALAIHREVGNRRGEAYVLSHLAIVHKNLGRPETALQTFEQALAIHREVGDRWSEGTVLGNLAALHGEQGRVEHARRLHEQALSICREIGSEPSETKVLIHMACLELVTRDDPRQARELAERGARLAGSRGDPLDLARLICCQGHIALAAGQPARELLQRAQALALGLQAGPDSELGKAVDKLRRAVEALERDAGTQRRTPLFRGYLLQDLPEGLKRWLVEAGQLDRSAIRLP